MSKVLAMDPTVELWWIPKCDQDEPEDQQFRIKHKYLTARDDAKTSDQMIKSYTKGKISKYEYLISSSDLKRCEMAIVGWVNFKYPENHPTKAGQEVPFSKENIGLIPPNIRSEFITYLTKRDEVESDDDGEGEDIDLGEAKTE